MVVELGEHYRAGGKNKIKLYKPKTFKVKLRAASESRALEPGCHRREGVYWVQVERCGSY